MQGLVTDRAQSNVLRRNELAAKGWSGMTADERAEWLGSPLSESAVNLLPYAPYYSSVVELRHTNDAVIAKATAAGSYLYAVQIIGAAADFENRVMTLSADYIGATDGATPQIAMYWHDGNGFEALTRKVFAASVGVENHWEEDAGTLMICAENIEVDPDTGEISAPNTHRYLLDRYSPRRYPYVLWGSDFYYCTYSRPIDDEMYAIGMAPVNVVENDAPVALTSAGSFSFNTGTNSNNRDYLAMYIYATVDAVVEAGASSRFRGVMLEFGDTRHEYVPYAEVIPSDSTKGAYNYSDLNRVERAAAELSELHGLNLETKTDWGIWDVPRRADMARYLANVRKIRQACMNPNIVAAAPESMSGLTYNDANNIEKILLTAHEHAKHIYRVGEIFSGEVN